MKRLLTLIFLATTLSAQTRWIEPRADSEGRLGSPLFTWGAAYIDSINGAVPGSALYLDSTKVATLWRSNTFGPAQTFNGNIDALTFDGFTLRSASAMDSLRVPALDESNTFTGATNAFQAIDAGARIRASYTAPQIELLNGSSQGWHLAVNNSTTPRMYFTRSGVADRVVLTSDGTLTLGTDSATGPFGALYAGAISGTTGTFSSTLRAADTIRAGNWTTYSYFIPGGTLVTSSDSVLKRDVRNASVNLAEFANVTPRFYKFKRENFIRPFDEKSVPDSVDVQLNDSTTVRKSNKSAKDSARIAFTAQNLADAERLSSVDHAGFLAKQFNQQLYGVTRSDIRQEDINVALWLKVCELEAEIKKLKEKP